MRGFSGLGLAYVGQKASWEVIGGDAPRYERGDPTCR